MAGPNSYKSYQDISGHAFKYSHRIDSIIVVRDTVFLNDTTSTSSFNNPYMLLYFDRSSCIGLLDISFIFHQIWSIMISL